jgi:hypothetical protein
MMDMKTISRFTAGAFGDHKAVGSGGESTNKHLHRGSCTAHKQEATAWQAVASLSTSKL